MNKPSDSNIAKKHLINFDIENVPTNDDFTPRRTAVSKRKREQVPQQQQEQNTTPLDAAIIETLKASKNDDTAEPKEKDTNTMFCLSLVDTMKTMSARDNAYVRLKIQELFFNIQHGES